MSGICLIAKLRAVHFIHPRFLNLDMNVVASYWINSSLGGRFGVYLTTTSTNYAMLLNLKTDFFLIPWWPGSWDNETRFTVYQNSPNYLLSTVPKPVYFSLEHWSSYWIWCLKKQPWISCVYSPNSLLATAAIYSGIVNTTDFVCMLSI